MPKRSKFRTAAAKQAHDLAAASWEALKRAHGVRPTRSAAEPYTPPRLEYRGFDNKPQSRIEATPASCAKPSEKRYTGNNIIGIGTMHKSNAVPVFSSEDAIAIASMRR
jgi:hypothetical protein